MRAVEQSELHQFEGLDVGDEGRIPCRAALREIVFDHPVVIGLGDDGPGILEPRCGGDAGAVGVGRCGHDAVHHGGGEGGVLCHVAPKLRVAQACEARDHLRHGAAILRKIVAAQHGEGREAAGLSGPQCLDEEAGRGARMLRMAEVVDDVGVLFVQLARRRIMTIALLGDGEGDDLHQGQAHGLDEGLRVLRRHDHAAQCADHAAAFARLVAFGNRVEIILRGQRIARVGGAEAGAHDAPAPVPTAQHGIGIIRHMRAVEGAHTQMHDADVDEGGVIGEALDGLERETVHHASLICATRRPLMPVPLRIKTPLGVSRA